jgi:hypothetical protein
MFSKDNPKNILKEGTCCGCFLVLLFIAFLTIIVASCVLAITGTIGYAYTYIMYSNIYNINTGCILNSTSACKIQVPKHGESCWCHLNTAENTFCCVGPGIAVSILTFIFIMMSYILCLCIGCCKADVMESYESAQQMTDVLIDKVTTYKTK